MDRLKIAVIPNLSKEKASACTDEILSVLGQCGCETLLRDDLFGKNGCFPDSERQELSGCDLFIAVGGDGTIIHTAKLAASFQKPVLGVNAGKLGFTAGLEADELYLLPKLLTGEYRLEQRAMLSVTVCSQGHATRFCAMNDAVVSGELAKIIDYQMALGKKDLAYHYRADGFIVATPTGSTAYSLSAGGPVLEPTVSCLVYTPICPHSLFNRSLIFGRDTKLQVKISENPGKIFLTLDGEEPFELQKEDYLSFVRSSSYAQFIKLNSSNFYDVLNQKIVENRH